MCVKTYVETSICREKDESGKYKKAVPVFKEDFSKEVRELWDMLNKPEKNKNLRDVYDKAGELIGSLNFLRNNLQDYSSYSDDESDFI